MLEPIITPLSFTYKREDTDVWVLNRDDIPLDPQKAKDLQIVHLGPGASGGNHQHSRTEWFIGTGDLVFVWLDEQGRRHQQPMYPNGQIMLIEVPPWLPHAVKNQSIDTSAVLFEFADGKMTEKEIVQVV